MVAVLRDGNMFLFSRRARPEAHLRGWGLPSAGGHIKPGENAEEAVAREAKEELGLDVKVLRCLGRVRHKVNLLVFECEPVGGELKPDPNEIQETRWVPLDRVSGFSENVLTDKIMRLYQEREESNEAS